MKRNGKNWLWPLLLTAMISCSAFFSPKPAAALSNGDAMEAIVVPVASVAVVGAAGYMLYQYRINQPADAKGRLGYNGPGEFFIGGFLGSSFVPENDWTYQIGHNNFTGRKMSINPGVLGGIKVGYFLDSEPNFGVEAEGSFGNQPQPSQTLSLRPPLGAATSGRVPSQTLLAWTMAFHFVGRYGFLQDQVVPFGRLQPYVGVGPGVVVLYGDADSAKNFSLEVEAGLRYMFTKNLGGFLEYKFSKQWSVELESQELATAKLYTSEKAVFDFDRHQVVVGLSYHF